MTNKTNLSVYDLESWPNYFSAAFYDMDNQQVLFFEVSWRRNDLPALRHHLEAYRQQGVRMVGFNNDAYDYSVLHPVMTDENIRNAYDIYLVNERIINTPWERRFDNNIPDWIKLIVQIDLMKIHHFDNLAKATSLKKIEFAMRSPTLEDLPYPPGIPLEETDHVADTVMKYNVHDIMRTVDFLIISLPALEFRDVMTEKYGMNFTNFNDTKIGKKYFVKQLEAAGVECYGPNGARQTWRDSIHLGSLILPYIKFERYEFNQVLRILHETTIQETKGAFSTSAVVDGFSFDFALGGIHGSLSGVNVHSDDEFIMIDADVASYYPNVAIKNRIFPEHLSSVFCDVYDDVFEQRKKYDKKTVENKAMKLALNGVYGDSNSKFSPFYDPAYTMATTINGQLMLCMLAEQLMKIPQLQMIQINTDGLTVRFPRQYKFHYDALCDWWQKLTCLTLEFVNYKSMYIRDVNNYIAVPVDKPIKYKGVYVPFGAHEDHDDSLEWHKNHSMLIVKKAAVAAILEGIPVRKFITEHKDIYDFFSLAKVARTESLQLLHDIKWDGVVIYSDQVYQDLQKTSRYLVTNSGHKLVKIMKPLVRKTKIVQMYLPGWISKKITGHNKNISVETEHEYNNAYLIGYRTKDGGSYRIGPNRVMEIEADRMCTIYNTVVDGAVYDIDYNYYIDEAEKLVNGVMGIK